MKAAGDTDHITHRVYKNTVASTSDGVDRVLGLYTKETVDALEATM